MAPRKAFPLRLRPEVYAALRRWADDELRSVNAQIEYLLVRALEKEGRWPEARRAGGRRAGAEPTETDDRRKG